MSHYQNTIIPVCPTLQERLDDRWLTCDPTQALSEQFPLMEFISSPANRNGIEQIIHDRPGKVKTVELLYAQRYLRSEVLTQDESFCTPGSPRGRLSKEYTLDPHDNVMFKTTLEEGDFTYNCQDAGSYFVEEVAALIAAVEERTAQKGTEEAMLLKGAWGSKNTSKVNGSGDLVVMTKIPSKQDVNPTLMTGLNLAFKKAGYCAPKIIAGGSDLYEYYLNTAAAGCCTDQGLDIGRILSTFGQAVAYDPYVVEALSNDETQNFAAQLGALQLLWFTRAGWKAGVPFISNGGSYIHTIVMSPRLGIPMDVYAIDACPGKVTISVSAVTKVVGLPDDMFKVNDNLEGVNWTGIISVENTCVDPCA